MTLVDVGIAIVTTSVVAVVYPIIIYPVLLALLHTVAKRPTTREIPAALPPLTVIIAAHNEASMIDACLRSFAQADYPSALIHVLVGDDGSTDGTADVVREWTSQFASLRIERFERRGKNGVLSALFSHVTTDLVVLTDADCRIAPSSLQRLVAGMSDPTVGCVIGRTDRSSTHGDTASRGEASYRGLEATMNAMESAIASTVTSNGHLYCVQRSLLHPLPDARASDDFLIPLLVILSGKRAIVDNDVLVVEERTNSVQQEMRRTIRTVSGGLASISVARALLAPSHGFVSWFLWSHRMIRWLMPWFVLMILVGTMLTVGDVEIFGPLFYLEFALAFGAFIGHMAEVTGVRLMLLQYVYFFFVMNASMLAGMIRFVAGGQIDRWSPSSKEAA